MIAHLDRVRALAQIETTRRVQSQNNFPMGAGIASSASAFAALSLAATRAAGLELSERELSILARQGSGSACSFDPRRICRVARWIREREFVRGSTCAARVLGFARCDRHRKHCGKTNRLN